MSLQNESEEQPMRNQMYTVSASDMSTILNILTYNDYARLYRALKRAGFPRRPSFTDYYNECKKYYDLPSISISAWRDAYDFIADLFDDNERFGTPCDEEAVFARQTAEMLMIFSRR